VVAANYLKPRIIHWKTEVEAWISKHIKLYCITSPTRIYNYLPHLPDLRRSIKDPLTDNNTTKADILIAKFFPKTRTADLRDTKIEAITEQRTLNISPIISIEEINKLITSLLNRKAPGPDGIPNKVLKVVALVIAKDLAEAASYYFTNGIIPKSLKESITVVLRKEGKKDYSLLGSYRPITLKNTLAKVLEKYVANIILEAAEEYRLLP